MTLPNFLIIGAQKAGTSWLAANLSQHPEVFMPSKEIHFFDKYDHFRKGIEWYQRFFDAAGDAKAIGEKTPDYLWANGNGAEGHLPHVHRNVHSVLNYAKLIILVRNPVDRAISAVNHIVRSGRVSPFLNINDLLLGKQRHLMDAHGVIDYGFYYRQIMAYREYFPSEQMLILVFEEDVVNNPSNGLRRSCEFLEIDPGFGFPNKGSKKNAYKASLFGLTLGYYLPFGKHLANAIDAFKPHKPRPGPDIHRRLKELYRPENEKLFELLGRRIDAWD
jgi:hypothetical protein